MKDFTKSERRTIRELAQIAWERELRSELLKLQASFDKMGKGELSPFDLNQEVYEFLQGVCGNFTSIMRCPCLGSVSAEHSRKEYFQRMTSSRRARELKPI